MLQRLDRKGRITFTDIADPGFEVPEGKTWDDLMARIHGRRDGEWIEGVEVFRMLYGAVGLAPVMWLTRLPLVAPLLDFLYSRFAANRLRLTGRCTPEKGCAVERPTSAGQPRAA